MANFTSSFISTADIGSWDYYIFSDNVGIWRSLNGLAAWFNSSGGLLQGAAWLGALIMLATVLFGAATHKPSLNSGTIGIWFFFMSMMGITGQANIYNIYTNQVTVVQNVPALALVPASVFSKAAFNVFNSMDTAFASTTGSYMSVSQSGFLGPLDVLLSLRSPKLATATPALNQTLTQVVHDCAIDPNLAAAAPPMSQSLDMLNWLTMYGRQNGLTRIFTENDSAGQVLGCSAALTYIDTQYGNLAGGNAEMLKFVNGATTKVNPQDPKGLWNATSMQNSFDLLIGTAIGMNQNAVEFTKNALVASTVTYTLDCLSQSGSMTTPENCATGALAVGDSMERWKTDSAMAGSGFLKTMFTSMGILQALFFALFPVIAIYGLIVVSKTAKVFGGYIFFGIWCQSWLLVVAPVQSYIQTSIMDEMSKITAGAHGMTLANSMAVYQSLSTKLAIAGDIMASSQMLSLALLSGSMVALSGLAGKWSGEQHMDSSKLQHDASKSAPLVQNNAMNSVNSMADSNGRIVSSNTKMGAGTYNLQSTFVTSENESHSNDQSTGHDQTRGTEAGIQAVKSSKVGMSREQAATVSRSLTAMDSVMGSIGTGSAKALGIGGAKLLQGMKGAPLSAAENKALDGAVAKAQEGAVKQLAAKDAGYLDKLMGNAGAEAQADAVGTMVDVAGAALTTAIVAGEFMSGIGAAATPATVAAAGLATQGAKMGLMAKIKSGAKEVAKDAAIAGVTKGPGALEAIAKGVSGDAKALFQATVQDAMKRDESSTAKKSRTKDSGITASESDKIAESWKASQSQAHSRSSSNGQTRLASVSLDKDQVARAGRFGVGDTTGEQLRSGAKANAALLSSISSPEKLAAAKREVDMATMGRSITDFGGGSMGQELMDYEKNVLLEHFLTGQVSNSMMNTRGGALLGGTVATISTPPVAGSKGHWEKAPTPAGQKPTPQGQGGKGTALQDWAHVNGDDPRNSAQVQAAGKAGFKWVPGKAGHEETFGLAPKPSEIPVGNTVRTTGLGDKAGHGKIYTAAAQRAMARGDREGQAEFDSLVSSGKALEQMAPAEVGDFNSKVANERLAVGGIAVVSVAAGVTEDVMRRGREATEFAQKPTPGGASTTATPAEPAKPQRTPVNRRTVSARRR